MAKNKRKSAGNSAQNNAETQPTSNVDNSGASGSSNDGPSVSAPAVDNSDLTWLHFNTMDRVNDQDLHEKCTQVIRLLKELDPDLGRFVWAVNFGNNASRAPREMRDARSQFRGSYLIPTLQNLRRPPRTSAKGDVPASAQEVIDNYALALVGRQFRDEMQVFEETYGGIQSSDLSEEKLLGIDLEKLEEHARNCAPGLFRTLWMLGTTRHRRRQWKINNKRPNLFIVTTLSGLAYQMSSRNNTIQQFFGHFFRAKQVPKTVIELLSHLGLSVSYPTITAAITKLSESAERALLEAIESRPFMMVTDNIRIGRAVGSQRLDNQTVTDNGTAATVFVMPESSKKAWFNPEAVRAARAHSEAQMALGTPLRIQFSDLACPQRQSRVLSHKLFHLFDILRAVPEFKNVSILSDPRLSRPAGFHDLEKMTNEMHTLRVRPYDETTYAGSIQGLRDFLQQLGFSAEDKIIKMTLEMMIPWIGDQLTVARLRGLQWQRQEEPNGFDRLDPFIFIFGWFHTLMCLASAIFENHRGSPAGLGFQHSVLILARRGFAGNMRQKRPDYHTVKEFLKHELEARVRGLWIQVAGVSTLEELKVWLEDPQRTVDELLMLSKRIQQERVSKQAVSFYEVKMAENLDDTDPVFLNTLIQNRDLEMFWDLDHAVKHGHVGHMEDLLPEFLVFFSGSKNSNYAKEMYEILQLMRHETTPEIRHAIREHCFLVNMEGRSDSFYPIDQRQEINIRGIQEYGPGAQGRTTWEDYEKICPLIPFFTKFTRHVQGTVEGIQRQSHIHKAPARKLDLSTLVRDHVKTKLLVPVPGREFATNSDRAKDFYKLGTISLQNSRSLDNYASKRIPYFRSRVTTNDFSWYHSRAANNDNDVTQTTPPPTPPNIHHSWSSVPSSPLPGA